MERLLLATAVPAAIYYFIKYRMLLDQVSPNRQADEAHAKSSSPSLVTNPEELQTLRQYVLSQDIAMIKSVDGVSFAESTTGQPVAWTKSLKESMEILPADQSLNFAATVLCDAI